MTDLEWAWVAAGEVVVATPERAWLHHPQNPSDPFMFSMKGPGSEATTAKLLEGAIGAGLRAGRAAGPPPPPLTLIRYVWRLVGYYHLTHSTPGLMAETAARFAAADRPELAAWAEEKGHDEAAHDQLALKDLKELGFSEGITTLQHPVAEAMVAWFKAAAAHPLPLGVVAYAHTVERLALTQDAAALAATRALLPPGSRAVRCLRVHSALGSDAAHVHDNVRVIARLPATERVVIALACREVAQLFSSAPIEGHLDDTRLEERFRPWRLLQGGST